ncbi:hypothetical protein BC477_14485 [Clavibacter michiganensis subsp. michiganensis]|nr:hypothetical protein BC477_14485 [Clavibacter michiganensis subsp. michiganensis]
MRDASWISCCRTTARLMKVTVSSAAVPRAATFVPVDAPNPGRRRARFFFRRAAAPGSSQCERRMGSSRPWYESTERPRVSTSTMMG